MGRAELESDAATTADWLRGQQTYWDSVAPRYDSLYESPWSRWENDLLSRRLARHFVLHAGDEVLDLGCGTALGGRLLQRTFGDDFAYTGVDISAEMLKHARRRLPTGSFHCMSVSQWVTAADHRFAAVMAIFASGSYVADLDGLLDIVYQSLRNDGVAYLSFLNRWSARRLLSLRISQVERYATRNDHHQRKSAPLATTYSATVLNAAVAEHGLVLERAYGGGPFAGWCELNPIWALNAKLAERSHAMSHLLEVVLRRTRE